MSYTQDPIRIFHWELTLASGFDNKSFPSWVLSSTQTSEVEKTLLDVWKSVGILTTVNRQCCSTLTNQSQVQTKNPCMRLAMSSLISIAVLWWLNNPKLYSRRYWRFKRPYKWLLTESSKNVWTVFLTTVALRIKNSKLINWGQYWRYSSSSAV